MWNTLNEEQKIEYKKYCDAKYGKTIVFCETGEPMYMDEEGYLIDTEIVVKLLFSVSKN
jgi:hypothetical protein